MKALTFWQPYASLIVWGSKRIENRPWKPPIDLLGKRIAIHAGMAYSKTCTFFEDIKALGDKAYIHGKIIGTAVVKDWHAEARWLPEVQWKWFTGPFGWWLDDVRALSTPVECRGYQKLWNLPEEIEKAISA